MNIWIDSEGNEIFVEFHSLYIKQKFKLKKKIDPFKYAFDIGWIRVSYNDKTFFSEMGSKFSKKTLQTLINLIQKSTAIEFNIEIGGEANSSQYQQFEDPKKAINYIKKNISIN
jgi:hypothetical protein